MTGEKEILAVWLMPAGEVKEQFKSLADQLAERFDAPVFEPHLTLYVTSFDDSLSLVPLNAMPLLRSVELEIEGVDSSDQFTKTLFVQFKPTVQLREVRAAVGRALERSSDYELNPHLSLLYRELPNEKKAELARSIVLPMDSVRFDTMKAIVSPAKISSRVDVESWRVIQEARLGG